MQIENQAIAFDIATEPRRHHSAAVPSAPTFAQWLAGFFSNSHIPNSTIGRLSHCPMLTV